MIRAGRQVRCVPRDSETPQLAANASQSLIWFGRARMYIAE
jgi:hypothetical protein